MDNNLISKEKEKQENEEDQIQIPLDVKELCKQSMLVSVFAADDDFLASTFSKNMKVLKTYFPDLYIFFSSYRPKRYHIDIKDNLINIKDTKTNSYIYKLPASLITKQQYNFYKKVNNKNHTNKYENGPKNNYIHNKYLNKIINVYSKLQKECKEEEYLSKNLNTILFFGVGIGFHLEDFVQNHFIGNLYILEPDLDLFYASLFSCSWHHIIPLLDVKGSNVQILLGEQADNLFDDFLKENRIKGLFNFSNFHVFTHYHSKLLEKKKSVFTDNYYKLISAWGFFDDNTIAIENTIRNIKQKVLVLNKTIKKTKNSDEIPVFICANGPSLDFVIDYIKKNEKKMIIVSCGTTVRTLMAKKIRPDIHIEQERVPAVLSNLNKFKDVKDFFKDTVLLCMNHVDPKVTSLFKNKAMLIKDQEANTFVLKNINEFAKNSLISGFANPTVINTATVTLNHLGFSNIYLCGVDLGYHETGLHHSKHSPFYYSGNKDNGYFKRSLEHCLEGFEDTKFYTNTVYKISADILDKYLALNESFNCKKLGDGVYLKNVEYLKDFNVPKLTKNIAKRKIINETLKKNSTSYLPSNITKEYAKNIDLKMYDYVLENIFKEFKKYEEKNIRAKELIENIYKIIENCTKYKESFYIKYLLGGSSNYFNSLIQSLFYYNTKDIKKEEAIQNAVKEYKIFFKKTTNILTQSIAKAKL